MVSNNKHAGKEAWGPVSPAPAPKAPPGKSVAQSQVVYHFSPAPYAVRQEIKRLTRPYSTPAHIARVEEEIVSGRPQTVAFFRGCDRLNQLEHEPTQTHNFGTHLPLRRSKSGGKQHAPLVPYHNSNGFEFAKSKEKIEVKIRTDDFFNRPETVPKVVRKSTLDPAIEALIARLQDQINDLTLYLEEERLNHRETIRRADEILREKIASVLRDHEEEMKAANEANEAARKDLTEKYESIISEQNKHMTEQIEKLNGEIKFLQSAFESYKTSLHNETNDKWKQREEEMISKHEEEIETKLEELRTRLLSEMAVDKNNVIKDHLKKLERLQQDHEREIESLTQKFAKNTLELKRLTGLEKTYEELRREHAHLTKKYKEDTAKLTQLATDLSDSKIKLLEFEASFHAKVQQVDERYKAEIHSLMTENTELRRSYMRKCGELYDSKVNFERMILEKEEELKLQKPSEIAVLEPKNDEYDDIVRRYSLPMLKSMEKELNLRPLSGVREQTQTVVDDEKEDSHVITDDVNDESNKEM